MGHSTFWGAMKGEFELFGRKEGWIGVILMERYRKSQEDEKREGSEMKKEREVFFQYLGSLAHANDALVPTSNDLALTDFEAEGFILG